MSNAKYSTLRKDEPSVKGGQHNDNMSWGFKILHGLAFVAGFAVLIHACWWVSEYIDYQEAMAHVAPPKFFIRLKGAEGLGLDPRASSPAPPVFHLTLDVEQVSPYYRACGGGGNSMLRITYHDMILAWGLVPSFCINGRRAYGVAAVDAKADGAVLTEGVLGLVQTELHVVGKADFGVVGEVTGLGYLRCHVCLFGGNATGNFKGLCQVNYYY